MLNQKDANTDNEGGYPELFVAVDGLQKCYYIGLGAETEHRSLLILKADTQLTVLIDQYPEGGT